MQPTVNEALLGNGGQGCRRAYAVADLGSLPFHGRGGKPCSNPLEIRKMQINMTVRNLFRLIGILGRIWEKGLVTGVQT